VNCSSLPTVYTLLLQSAVNPHICCIVPQRTDWLMIVTDINKVAL